MATALKSGDFYGHHNKELSFKSIKITDTEYTHDKVDWHYHENAYFTYLLRGCLTETNKKKRYVLEPGHLLFHKSQDPHCNAKSPQFSRGIHVELDDEWFSKYDINIGHFEGVLNLSNPILKNKMNKLFLEINNVNSFTEMSIDMLLIDCFDTINNYELKSNKPEWVTSLNDMIWEDILDASLESLGLKLNIHPVHLSREFNRYFGSTFSQYIRLLRINKATSLMIDESVPLTFVGYESQFYDQSHFINNFKKVYDMTPTEFLKKNKTMLK